MSSTDQIRFSIITPVYNLPVDILAETVESVLAQTYQNWEWILVDDCSPNGDVLPALKAHAERDPRIVVHARPVNGGIVAASNDGIDRATGEFIALLDHDDLLTTDALSTMSRAIDELPDDIDYLYSDEDKVLEDGTLGHAFRKPDWSPERFRHHMYTCHLSVIRTSLVKTLGGFRPGYDGSQDWDLVLRVTEQARRIHHVRRVLYHWRMMEGSTAGDSTAKPYARDAGARAIKDHLDRLGVAASVEYRSDLANYELHREPDLTTPTSIIIPTRGSVGRVWGTQRCFVIEAVRSVLAHTQHQSLQFVVVYDTSMPDQVIDELRTIPGADVTLVPFEAPFNFSTKCNLGALHATGEILVFLNDDIQAESDEVIGQLIAPLSEPGVGMTGPKLLFENQRIQHAGLLSGPAGYGHSHYKAIAGGPRRVELSINREVSALTGACIAITANLFHEVGGFTEQLAVNYNDVDLSLKVRRDNYRLVWLWDVVLWHFESISRSPVVHAWETAFMTQRWGATKSQIERYNG
ncbi:glycosyltransferase [Aeromicrobium sp. CFBP 8757]|uniref:glycosyltransferase family 2 protein n=1 Tax=Aeromicrobium sp. CFBP 8757 TaxID=2775288 RepID=UPI00177E703E|nr:glycosyltransferase [Aeromicrobium sp. CFBP 8757]MBD8606667.1 glycosyltransferase [Aeromicrobium sp. CFBP 8757]